MMFAEKVHPGDLLNRLNAEAYAPDHLMSAKKLHGAGLPVISLGEIVTKPINNSIRGVTGNLDLPSASIPMFRPADISGWFADSETAPKLTKNFEAEHAKSRVYPGDIVLGIAGTVGCVGRVPQQIEFGNVNGSSARIACKDGTEGGYLLAYLGCRFGQSSLLRLGVGSVQRHLNLEDLPVVEVSYPNVFARAYIGDKVRQAERLRAWAMGLRGEVDGRLNNLAECPVENPAMVNRVAVAALEDRLDPRPYRSHYVALATSIESRPFSRLSEIVELASGCPVSSGDFIPNSAVPLVRIRNIGFNDFLELDTGVSESLHASESRYQATEGMIVVGMDGIFRAQFILAEDLPMLVNQRVAILKAHRIRPELLTHWLNRVEGQMQLNQWAVKTTVEHTSLSDIGRIRVPRLEASEEDLLADKLMSARLAFRYSRYLTTSAKSVVEALIEGVVTEADLIAAQQALSSGSEQLDRALLARLKTDGFDGAGDPLFPDLDQLYELLDQAEQDDGK